MSSATRPRSQAPERTHEHGDLRALRRRHIGRYSHRNDPRYRLAVARDILQNVLHSKGISSSINAPNVPAATPNVTLAQPAEPVRFTANYFRGAREEFVSAINPEMRSTEYAPNSNSIPIPRDPSSVKNKTCDVRRKAARRCGKEVTKKASMQLAKLKKIRSTDAACYELLTAQAFDAFIDKSAVNDIIAFFVRELACLGNEKYINEIYDLRSKLEWPIYLDRLIAIFEEHCFNLRISFDRIVQNAANKDSASRMRHYQFRWNCRGCHPHVAWEAGWLPRSRLHITTNADELPDEPDDEDMTDAPQFNFKEFMESLDKMSVDTNWDEPFNQDITGLLDSWEPSTELQPDGGAWNDNDWSMIDAPDYSEYLDFDNLDTAMEVDEEPQGEDGSDGTDVAEEGSGGFTEDVDMIDVA